MFSEEALSKLAFWNISLEEIKLYFEIAAYALGSVFILLKLIDGSIDATMEVSLELEREEVKDCPESDFLAIKLGLKRADRGRLKLQEIVLVLSDASGKNPEKVTIIDKAVEQELAPMPPGRNMAKWMYLPPKEGTQLGYFYQAERGVPILVEVTIEATRTGFGGRHRPQWRASAVSLPNSMGS